MFKLTQRTNTNCKMPLTVIQKFNVFIENTDIMISYIQITMERSNSLKNVTLLTCNDFKTPRMHQVCSSTKDQERDLYMVQLRRISNYISIQVAVWCLILGSNRFRCGLNGVGGDG